MSRDLPRSRPAARHVDPAAVLGFVEAVDADPAVELHSLMVLRHGHVVAEGWWAPHAPHHTRLLYSLSKSFTSAALGIAVQEGLLDLDDTAVSCFPELDGDIRDARSRSITLRHLASMASGHTRDMIEDATRKDPHDPVRGFLMLPPPEEPGTVFAYNQPCTYTLASAIQRAAGMRLTEYLRPRLFDPLGIGEVGWLTWQPGVEQGFSGLFARTEDVAKLGQLFLQRGRWAGAQLLPEAYVDEASSRQVGTPDGPDVDWRRGYGYQFWISRHGYRGDGAFGQFCIVLPEHDAVVAITAGTQATQAVLDHVWDELLPGLTVDPDPAVQDELDQRLRGLRLPSCQARPAPPRPDTWADRTFRVARPDGEGTRTSFDSVRVRVTGDGLEVTLTEPGDTLTFPVGTTDWRVSASHGAHGVAVPVAASGGWLDDGNLRVEVVFLETPHRMDIVCAPDEGTARAAWRDEPLGGGRLRTLRRPRAGA